MEIASSALTGALRVGVQVVVGRKRPVIEFYQQLHNDFGPPFEIDQKNSAGKTVRVDKHRFQNIFIDITLINIGGERAENVTFKTSGDFRREEPRQCFPALFDSVIRQMAPGQSLYLMRVEQFDLNTFAPEKPGDNSSFKAVGIKNQTLSLTADYDGPDTWLNRLLRWPRRLRGLKQYSTEFTFDPMNFVGDLPPPNYS